MMNILRTPFGRPRPRKSLRQRVTPQAAEIQTLEQRSLLAGALGNEALLADQVAGEKEYKTPLEQGLEKVGEGVDDVLQFLNRLYRARTGRNLIPNPRPDPRDKPPLFAGNTASADEHSTETV